MFKCCCLTGSSGEEDKCSHNHTQAGDVVNNIVNNINVPVHTAQGEEHQLDQNGKETNSVCNILNKNRTKIVKKMGLKTSLLWDFLLEYEVISDDCANIIKEENQAERKQAGKIIDEIRRRPDKFENFKRALFASGQGFICYDYLGEPKPKVKSVNSAQPPAAATKKGPPSYSEIPPSIPDNQQPKPEFKNSNTQPVLPKYQPPQAPANKTNNENPDEEGQQPKPSSSSGSLADLPEHSQNGLMKAKETNKPAPERRIATDNAVVSAWERSLKKNYDYLMQHVELESTTLWDYLQAQDIISQVQVEEIKKENKENREMVRALIDHLLGGTIQTYHSFLDALAETGQGHIVKNLRQDYVETQWRLFLLTNRLYIVEQMDFEETLLWDAIQAQRIINQFQVETIKTECSNNNDMAEAFIDQLLKRTRSDYEKFASAFTDIGNSQIANFLLEAFRDNEDWKVVLQKNRVYLVQNVDMESDLWDCLVSEGIISASKIQSIKLDCKAAHKQVGALINHLLKRSKVDYDKFLHCLVVTGQGHVVQKLTQSDENGPNKGFNTTSQAQNSRYKDYEQIEPYFPPDRQPSSLPMRNANEEHSSRSQQLYYQDPHHIRHYSPASTSMQPPSLPMASPQRALVASSEPIPQKAESKNVLQAACLSVENQGGIEDIVLEISQPSPKAEILSLKSKLARIQPTREPPEIDEMQYRNIIEKEDCYPMRNGTRGRAVVITMTGNRKGWTKDVLAIEEMFRYLNVISEHKFDLSRQEIRSELESFASSKENTDVDVLFVVLMGHGGSWNNEDYLMAADGRIMIIRDEIKDMFNNKTHPSLIDKPKIFIVQMCRGGGFTLGIEVPAFIEAPSYLEADAHGSRITSLFSDYIFGYATQPDLVAMRDIISGTWYIQILTQVFMEDSHLRPVSSLFSKVNAELEKRAQTSERGAAQVGETVSSLKKTLYLFPGYQGNSDGGLSTVLQDNATIDL